MNTDHRIARDLSGLQRAALTLARVAVGWHFLYEGVIKLMDAQWTAGPYLASATGPLAGFFRALAANDAALRIVDPLNAWGLALVGLALMAGALTRPASIGGIALLALYYAARPSLIGAPPDPFAEGSYLVVNKTLVELVVLAVFAAFPGRATYGFDGLFCAWRSRRKTADADAAAAEPAPGGAAPVVVPAPPPAAAPRIEADLGRREILRHLAVLPFLGAFVVAFLRKRGWKSHEEAILKKQGVDGVTSATIKTFTWASMKDLKAPIPHGKIGKLGVSKVILGGNLIGGWAHARDLIYVSKLVKAYHHEQKVFDTLALAERCGITAILTNPILCGVIGRYWRYAGGKIGFISDCGGNDLAERVKMSIDQGACSCYVQGETADRLVREGKFDEIARALELTRASGLPAGIGGHRLETVQACVEKGLKPDFWMKTFHHLKYWSARPNDETRDNRFCDDPDAVREFMASREEPWIAFKVLAAGAIPPQDGFRYAFENGADFVCCGMYDFQIVEDINLANKILSNIKNRPRPWRG